jgi:hypothetical protein
MKEETNQLTLKILDAFLMIIESRVIVNAKNEAVRKQDFEKAVYWRDLETDLEKKLPPFVELQKWRDELDALITKE